MDTTLLNIAHVVLIILVSVNLLLTAGLYVIYKKKNGAGEKSPEYWEAWFGKILDAEREALRLIMDAIADLKRTVERMQQ